MNKKTKLQTNPIADDITVMGFALLPIVEMGGWTGSAQAWKVYFPDWRISKNLSLALVDLFTSKNRRAYNSTRNKIVETFYGGESSLDQIKKDMIKMMPSISKNLYE